MFESLLVANRGEIACRIIHSARELGVRTIAVYSDVDAHAQHVRQADVAYAIGDNPAQHSYLNIDKIIDVARRSGAQAVHPGYGFLSENPAFARACDAAGIVFVGPSAQAMELMGSKIAAKNTVAAAGTPVVPGYQGPDQSDAELTRQALQVGFPLLIKASSSGGGKGMRRVAQAADFESALASVRREALAAFGDEQVLLERYLSAPKHLEVQILADGQGTTLHLHERDCSMQRRHQKVIEEAPGSTVSPALRMRLGAAAVRAAAAINYCGAGTIEFICEGEEFFFMEMNTRLQVEHPVTEAITGLDLVAWQLRIAAGERLTLQQEDVLLSGHALEARIYAENPSKKFLPSSGPLHHVYFPDSVRVDTGVVSGDAVSPFYDPMIAKVIAHGPDRESARLQLLAALQSTEIVGIEHNVGYLGEVLKHPAFVRGDYTTVTLESEHVALTPEAETGLVVLAALGYRALLAQADASPPASFPKLGLHELGEDFRLSLIHGRGKRKRQLQVVVHNRVAQVEGQAYHLEQLSWVNNRLAARLGFVDGSQVDYDIKVLLVGDLLFCLSKGYSVKWQLDGQYSAS